MSATDPIVTDCPNLDEAIAKYTTQLGYRLDMIAPADAPREALVSRDGERVRLVLSPGFSRQGPPEGGTQNEWITGRAGMEYRDLIPGRLGGRVIASHIRLTKGGEVPDYVHYHKVDFQMIYCKRGRIKVVYEDQGPPFWLETGDCVLQPPEIRHRVLECTAGAEVIEVSMPAEHETWVEHEVKLPTPESRPERDFSGQRFVRHIAKEAEWKPVDESGYEYRRIGIGHATQQFGQAIVTRPVSDDHIDEPVTYIQWAEVFILFLLKGEALVTTHEGSEYRLMSEDCLVMPPGIDYTVQYARNTEILEVTIGSTLN